jgi:hypothetical protein
MAAFIDALPLALPLQILERYVGEYKAASGFTATVRLEGDQLLVKSGANPEVPLSARSATRFFTPQGSVFEFQVAGQGPAVKVTGVILEQGAQRIPLERK